MLIQKNVCIALTLKSERPTTNLLKIDVQNKIKDGGDEKKEEGF